MLISASSSSRISRASACNKCKEKPGACVFNDDVCNSISAKFAECDALIVGSPVYWGQPNGAVLSVIQRAFYSNGGAIAGKPAAAKSLGSPCILSDRD